MALSSFRRSLYTLVTFVIPVAVSTQPEPDQTLTGMVTQATDGDAYKVGSLVGQLLRGKWDCLALRAGVVQAESDCAVGLAGWGRGSHLLNELVLFGASIRSERARSELWRL